MTTPTLKLDPEEFEKAFGRRGTAFRTSHDVALLSAANFESVKSKIATCSSFDEFLSMLDTEAAENAEMLTARRGSLILDLDLWADIEDATYEITQKVRDCEAARVTEWTSTMLQEVLDLRRKGGTGASYPFGYAVGSTSFGGQYDDLMLALDDKWYKYRSAEQDDQILAPAEVILRNITGDVVWRSPPQEFDLRMSEYGNVDLDGDNWHEKGFEPLATQIFDELSGSDVTRKLHRERFRSLLEILNFRDGSEPDGPVFTILPDVQIEYGCISGGTDAIACAWRYFPVEKVCLSIASVAVQSVGFQLPRPVLSALQQRIRDNLRDLPQIARDPAPPTLRFQSDHALRVFVQTVSEINDLLSGSRSDELAAHVVARCPEFERTHRILMAPHDKLGLILDMGGESRAIDEQDDLVSTIDFVNSKEYAEYHQLDPDRTHLVYEMQIVFKGEQPPEDGGGDVPVENAANAGPAQP